MAAVVVQPWLHCSQQYADSGPSHSIDPYNLKDAEVLLMLSPGRAASRWRNDHHAAGCSRCRDAAMMHPKVRLTRPQQGHSRRKKLHYRADLMRDRHRDHVEDSIVYGGRACMCIIDVASAIVS